MSSSNFHISAKVQLHLHLEGAIRLKTIQALAAKHGVSLSLEQLEKDVVMTSPETLTTFLGRFVHWMPYVRGDMEAIRLLAREVAEDLYKDNVIYCEVRYCPALVTGDKLTTDEVVEAVLDEFTQAELKYNIKIKQILCCIRSMPEVSHDILRLCEKYRDRGVVGMDIAGDENAVETDSPTPQEVKDVFRKARETGINITVHAGENGSAAVVHEAVEEMYAQRIGHGYRTLEDEDLYRRLVAEQMHFECCPSSSILTGACSPDWHKHAVKRFATDGANFSLSTDDPTVTATTLSKEFSLVEQEVLIPRIRLLKCIFDAARSSFLPADEKQELLNRLHSVYDSEVPEAKTF